MNLAIICLFVLIFGSVYAQQDIECLKEFKSSVNDPEGSLASWTFPPSGSRGICSFSGVQCLHDNDSRAYAISLSQMGLTGSFPKGLSKCQSLTTLDISENGFTGPLPSNICSTVLPYLVDLSVRSNEFSGSIVSSFMNCSYVNNLDLSNNKFTGVIPGEIAQFPRLKKFDVSNNDFNGLIPPALAVGKNLTAESFQGNPKLCGPPLKNCRGNNTNIGLIVGVAAGGALALVAAAVVVIWFLPVKVRPIKAVSKDEWAKRIRAPHSVAVSLFEKPLTKLKLADLMSATNNFSQENIIGSGRTGVVYKASFPDGTMMAIKRLKLSAHVDKQFKSEMETLGKLRHRNLVPLLGYCIADSEKLLVYKYMPNGSVKDWLHNDGFTLDWPKRLKIAVGAARGIAWLHHSCNPRIIHRNISASSILLDEDFEAKITDFGLARLMNPVDTHISTFVNGDFGDVGYVAPEYIRTLVATVRGDVYSFGVVLLEMITGQKPVEVMDEEGFGGSLVEWVGVHAKNGTLERVISSSLRGPEVDAEQMQFLKVAHSCTSANPKERPSSYEVYQLIRAIGQKYHFSDQNDEIPLVDVSVDIDYPDELIVAPHSG